MNALFPRNEHGIDRIIRVIELTVAALKNFEKKS